MKAGIKDLQVEIERLQQEYPNLKSFRAEQLRSELLAIEANTYAEFVKAGRLNKELSPLLPDVLQVRDGEAR